MLKVGLIIISLTAISFSGFAKPYFGLQIGSPSISSAKSHYDNAAMRVSFGYEVPVTPDFSFLVEAGYNSSQEFDAGKLESSNDTSHVSMHIGSRLDGLAGVKYRLSRVSFSLLGGATNAVMSNYGNAAEEETPISKSQTEVALRLGYQYNPNVVFNISVNKVMGSSSPLFIAHSTDNKLTLNAIPSVTTVFAGINLSV